MKDNKIFRICPQCNASVRDINFSAHMLKTHDTVEEIEVLDEQGKKDEFLTEFAKLEAKTLKDGKIALPCKACANSGKCTVCGQPIQTSRQKNKDGEWEMCVCTKCGKAHEHALIVPKERKIEFKCTKCKKTYYAQTGRIYLEDLGKNGPNVNKTRFQREIRCTGCGSPEYAFTETTKNSILLIPFRARVAKEYGLQDCLPEDHEVVPVAGVATYDGESFENYLEALDHLETKIFLNPNDVEAKVRYANALRLGNDYDYAVEQYLAALKIDPECSDALLELGFVNFYRGNIRDAETYLIRARQALLKHGALYSSQTDSLLKDVEKILRKISEIPD